MEMRSLSRPASGGTTPCRMTGFIYYLVIRHGVVSPNRHPSRTTGMRSLAPPSLLLSSLEFSGTKSLRALDCSRTTYSPSRTMEMRSFSRPAGASPHPRKALRGGISKSIIQGPCQFLAINAHKMASGTRRRLQERGRDTPTKGLAWSGVTSTLSIALLCTTCRRIPSSASTKPGPETHTTQVVEVNWEHDPDLNLDITSVVLDNRTRIE